MTENQLPTGGERPTGDRDVGARESGPEHRDDRIDPTADGLDVARIEHEIEGWGGATMPSYDEHELTPQQGENLQDPPQPIGGGGARGPPHGRPGKRGPRGQGGPP